MSRAPAGPVGSLAYLSSGRLFLSIYLARRLRLRWLISQHSMLTHSSQNVGNVYVAQTTGTGRIRKKLGISQLSTTKYLFYNSHFTSRQHRLSGTTWFIPFFQAFPSTVEKLKNLYLGQNNLFCMKSFPSKSLTLDSVYRLTLILFCLFYTCLRFYAIRYLDLWYSFWG